MYERKMKILSLKCGIKEPCAKTWRRNAKLVITIRIREYEVMWTISPLIEQHKQLSTGVESLNIKVSSVFGFLMAWGNLVVASILHGLSACIMLSVQE